MSLWNNGVWFAVRKSWSVIYLLVRLLEDLQIMKRKMCLAKSFSLSVYLEISIPSFSHMLGGKGKCLQRGWGNSGTFGRVELCEFSSKLLFVLCLSAWTYVEHGMVERAWNVSPVCKTDVFCSFWVMVSCNVLDQVQIPFPAQPLLSS